MAEFESSGLGRVAFCQAHHLSLSTLARYRKRRTEKNTTTSDGWLAVEVAGNGGSLTGGSHSGLALALAGGRRIEIGHGFHAQTLVRLLSVLERV